jgi:cardiolipin synthase (CMP-forming)
MAHALTLIRLLAVAPLVYGMASGGACAAVVAAVALAIAIVTDLLDGKVARSRGTASAFGRVFDHATDCAFVTAGLAAVALRGALPWALPLLVAAAFAQYTADSWYARRAGLTVASGLRMSRVGRWNGILYFVPLVVDTVARLGTALAVPVAPALLGAAVPWIAWALAASTLCSMADRAIAVWRLGAETPVRAISRERAG